MDSYSRQPAWWGYHRPPPKPRSIVELIAAGSLDAELAALLWLLIEGRVPIVVAAGPPLAGKTTMLTALLDFLAPTTRTRFLAGMSEDFAWLPEAAELGWRGGSVTAGPVAGNPDRPSAVMPPADPGIDYLVANELSSHLPAYTWGEQARIVVRALSLGYGLGATIHAESLGDVFDQLRSPEVGLTDDEMSHLGVVLVMKPVRPDGRDVVDGWGRQPLSASDVRRRIVAVHYVRPLARDGGGHLRRLGPAVLATWDVSRDELEHFAWGVVPELAGRVGRRAGDFEREQARRAEYLAGLVERGVTGVEEVRAAIAGYLSAGAIGPTN